MQMLIKMANLKRLEKDKHLYFKMLFYFIPISPYIDQMKHIKRNTLSTVIFNHY